MIKAAIYNIETGEIRNILYSPTESILDLNLEEGYRWVVCTVSDSEIGNYKINLSSLDFETKTTQTITPTPSSIDADGVTKSTLTGIATGTFAYRNTNESIELLRQVNSGKMYFCTNIVATHTLTFKHPLYLDTEVEITATTP